ncbi:hypothetical protein K457DRAFT_25471 [Linnemannia elongata AG-77]|uniref:Uncharacterized protein n=1 Tax=Linnemannia elongata AG-77 TaxID=1314771 RepID=A0A197JD46_9FUNG|nr:hypothetical protein K457DRAFT_25471 [Linnemannia elongata AG-77]
MFNVGLITEQKNIIPIALHGAAGTAVGSKIKSYAKRAGSKLTQQHRQYGPVGHTVEDRTSRVCSACFVPVTLSRATRIEDGDSKTIRQHGSGIVTTHDIHDDKQAEVQRIVMRTPSIISLYSAPLFFFGYTNSPPTFSPLLLSLNTNYDRQRYRAG